MIIKKHHTWDLTYRQAAGLQKDLVKKLVLHDHLGRVKKIAGVDAKYEKKSHAMAVTAAVLVFSYPEFDLMEESISRYRRIRGMEIMASRIRMMISSSQPPL